MLDIKFRGKCIYTKNWVKGSYTAMRKEYKNNPFDKSNKTLKIFHEIWQYEPGDWGMGGYANYEIDYETLGMFSGYVDNDGVEIYDGDILGDMFIVVFEEGCFKLKYKDDKFGKYWGTLHQLYNLSISGHKSVDNLLKITGTIK